jgi:septum formation protein
MTAYQSRPLVLASSSKYRKELLSRLQIDFTTVSPDIDETTLPGETAPMTAIRLAVEKAKAVAAAMPNAVIIGSDQVCEVSGKQLGKPGTRERAIEQLTMMSGQAAHFLTAVCVIQGDVVQQALVPTVVRFRPLSTSEIDRYVEREPAFDCAGAAKIESLGISLIDSVTSDDPTAIIGLPMITVARMLRQLGYPV